MFPDAELCHSLLAGAQQLARAFQLPLRNQNWRGLHGHWNGSGSGSSIDFQDHRPYLPGDDPRYLDWKAYARSGHYTMKLYREEVSPAIDLVVDLSASMFFDPAKAARSLELFAFAAAAAERSRAHVRTFCLAGEWLETRATKELLNPSALKATFEKGLEHPGSTAAPALERIPWRSGSLRVWISDLLFPGTPVPAPLAAGKGRGVILVPTCAAERDPAWEGNMEIIECETGQRRRQRVDEPLRRRYLDAYAQHFALWRDAARRYGVALASVAAEPPLSEALRQEALPSGVVEPV